MMSGSLSWIETKMSFSGAAIFSVWHIPLKIIEYKNENKYLNKNNEKNDQREEGQKKFFLSYEEVVIFWYLN